MPAQAGGLSMDVRLLFNPSMQTPLYLVPGVMCMISTGLSAIGPPG